jgi:hypothetical protein
MRGLTLHLESIDFINKLIENNPDLNIAIKDALIDKVIKRLIGKDYTMIRLENEVSKKVKEEVNNTTTGKIKDDIKKRIREEINNAIDENITDTLESVYEDRVLAVLTDIVDKHVKRLESLDLEKMIQEEVKKQVNATLCKFLREEREK